MHARIYLSLFAEDAIVLLYKLINDLDSLCSNIFYFDFEKNAIADFVVCIDSEVSSVQGDEDKKY